MNKMESSRETHERLKRQIKARDHQLENCTRVYDEENKMWVYWKPDVDTVDAMEDLKFRLNQHRNEKSLATSKGVI